MYNCKVGFGPTHSLLTLKCNKLTNKEARKASVDKAKLCFYIKLTFAYIYGSPDRFDMWFSPKETSACLFNLCSLQIFQVCDRSTLSDIFLRSHFSIT